jgi:hypothetical protein
VEATVPGHSATVLVALAIVVGSPVNTNVGNERKLPPPASEFSAPAISATRKSSEISVALR